MIIMILFEFLYDHYVQKASNIRRVQNANVFFFIFFQVFLVHNKMRKTKNIQIQTEIINKRVFHGAIIDEEKEEKKHISISFLSRLLLLPLLFWFLYFIQWKFLIFNCLKNAFVWHFFFIYVHWRTCDLRLMHNVSNCNCAIVCTNASSALNSWDFGSRALTTLCLSKKNYKIKERKKKRWSKP